MHGNRDERVALRRRVRVAWLAVRTVEQRRRVLADLAVQPGWLWHAVAHPGVVALAAARLPPLESSGEGGLTGACDRRALAREAAALRLERAEAGCCCAWCISPGRAARRTAAR
jgi:hypothetical protein